MSLSVCIMAHPKRAEQVARLQAVLGALPVVWDERQDRWDTGKRAMLAYDPACTHHLVIQDDVLPCRDLLAGVEAALEHMPDDAPLCLYVGRRRPHQHQVAQACAQADRLGAAFITMHTLNWGPGIAVPTAAIPEMVAYSDKLTEIKNYDRRLSRYWECEAKVRVWYTWPSLLDHADGPSLVHGRVGTDREHGHISRVAHRFLGEDVSALSVDWSGPVYDAEGPFGPGQPQSSPAALRIGPGVVAFRNKVTGQVRTMPSHSTRVRRYSGLSNWEPVTEGGAA